MWEEVFVVGPVDPRDVELLLTVWKWDFASSHLALGRVNVDLRPLHEQTGAVRQGRVPLLGDDGTVTGGTLSFEVTPLYGALGPEPVLARVPSTAGGASAAASPAITARKRNKKAPTSGRASGNLVRTSGSSSGGGGGGGQPGSQLSASAVSAPSAPATAPARGGGQRKWRKRAAEKLTAFDGADAINSRIAVTQGELYLMGSFALELQDELERALAGADAGERATADVTGGALAPVMQQLLYPIDLPKVSGEDWCRWIRVG